MIWIVLLCIIFFSVILIFQIKIFSFVVNPKKKNPHVFNCELWHRRNRNQIVCHCHFHYSKRRVATWANILKINSRLTRQTQWNSPDVPEHLSSSLSFLVIYLPHFYAILCFFFMFLGHLKIFIRLCKCTILMAFSVIADFFSRFFFFSWKDKVKWWTLNN